MSIQPNELRIGNLFYHMGEAVAIDAIDSDGCFNILADSGGNIASNREIADPIPLTPEWLERMGYQKHYLDFWAKLDEYGNPEGDFCILEYKDGGFQLGINLGEYGVGEKITYVHQLQNLYFALIGQELTVKRKA